MSSTTSKAIRSLREGVASQRDATVRIFLTRAETGMPEVFRKHGNGRLDRLFLRAGQLLVGRIEPPCMDYLHV